MTNLLLEEAPEKKELLRIDTPNHYQPWGLDYNGSHLAAICRDTSAMHNYVYLIKFEFVSETSENITTTV